MASISTPPAGSEEPSIVRCSPTPEERAEMERRTRVNHKIAEAYDIVAEALDTHFDKRKLAGECLLFSGGNDSSVLAHLFRNDVDYFVHINTGIYVLDPDGSSAAENYVRECANKWDVPLIVEHGDSYDELVMEQGFPGPGHHYKMFQRLKERGLIKVRRRLVSSGWKERVLFIAGRRSQESSRRKNIPRHERDKAQPSIVWASPLVNWSSEDMADYRKVFPDVPYNPVSAELHMSGECLCGAFAHKNELEEIEFWRPDTAARIKELEAKVVEAGNAPPERCKWGWGADVKGQKAPRKTGVLCSSCELRLPGLED